MKENLPVTRQVKRHHPYGPVKKRKHSPALAWFLRGPTWWLWAKVATALLVFLVCVGIGLAGGLYYYHIVLNPGEHMRKENILAAISPESPVYYHNGKDKIGVFFAKDHRHYVQFQEAPRLLIDAIMSAEDADFYHHPGVSIVSIFRAVAANFIAGRVVQGGSTITMQTAENLFQVEKPKNKWVGKVFELLNTLRLEYWHGKDQILEFYINQFHVAGNGRGAAIAAQYYFSKDLKDVNLIEAAFIAGSLKGPFNYTPFVYKDEKKRKAVAQKAFTRKNYVVGNMYKLGKISKLQWERAMKGDIPFVPSEFRYDSSIILDYVRDTLEEKVYKDALREAGIDNIATSGIKVITTIHKDVQEAAEYAVKKNLSQLSTKLEGYRAPSFVRKQDFTNKAKLVPGEFVLGKIQSVHLMPDIKKSSITIDLGSTIGTIDYTGFYDTLLAQLTYKEGKWVNNPAPKIAVLLKDFTVGAPIFASVRSVGGDGLLLDLEKRPEIDGSLLLVQRGKIMAMVGGFENKNFNRAIYSKRQVGSVFKPITFYGAFQLGWQPLDTLDNLRKVYQYSDTFYFPKPDHDPATDKVSIAWAVAQSENLASIEALYRLCDKLTPEQFRSLAEKLGLTPQNRESESEYRLRMQKQGLLLTEDKVNAYLFDVAVDALLTDLAFSEDSAQIRALKSMRFGNGFDDHKQKILADLKQILSTKFRDGYSASVQRDIAERYARWNMLCNNYIRLKQALNELLTHDALLKKIKERLGVALSLAISAKDLWGQLQEDEQEIVTDVAMHFYKAQNGKIAYFDKRFHEEDRAVPLVEDLKDQHPLAKVQGFEGMLPEDFFYSYVNWSNLDAVMLNNLLSVQVFSDLEKRVLEKRGSEPFTSEYSFENLSRMRDFRLLVGLRFLTKMLRKMGVSSEIEEVLSFPLGSNAVSILDVAKIYETMAHGRVYDLEDNNLVLIDRILSSKGEVIYERVPYEERILDPAFSFMLKSSLRKTFEIGTAKASKEAVWFKTPKGVKVGLPLFGKTGTTNDYTSSVFVGYMPYLAPGQRVLADDDVVTAVSYVGYDDNTKMVNKSFRVSGSVGALPQWTRIAQEITKIGDFSRLLSKQLQGDEAFADQFQLDLRYGQGPIKYLPVRASDGTLIEDQPAFDSPPRLENGGLVLESLMLDELPLRKVTF